jgi:hypothetical protein
MRARRFLTVTSCVCVGLFVVPAMWGQYNPVQTYLSGPWGATAVAVADVNGDGKPDILVGDVAGDKSSSVSVLLGNGDGTFQAASPLYSTGGHSVTQVAVADLNGDGRPDVVVSQMEGVAVLLGNGDGSFQAPMTYAIDSINGSSGVAVADVNRDGKLDLMVAAESGVAVVLLGNGDGTFGAQQAFGTAGHYPSSIAVADVNRDGKLDLILNNADSAADNDTGSVAVLLGNGDGTFQAAQDYDMGGFNGGTLAVADLNGDGNPDVAVANACAEAICATSSVSVLLGRGDGSFQNPKIYTNTGGYAAVAIAIADVEDLEVAGIPDLIVVNACDNSQECDQGTVGLLLGEGNGAFLPAYSYDSGGWNATSLAIADVNGDGIPDIFVANALNLCCGNSGVVGVLLSIPPATKDPTSTSLTSSRDPSLYGQAVVLTASVTSAGTIPTGKVSFTWGNYTIGSAKLNAAGVATLTNSRLNADVYPLVAVYKGDFAHSGSSSPVLSQVVEETASAARIVSSQNPSAPGQAVTFTATITATSVRPTGPVTFNAGNELLGTAQLAGGKAEITPTSLPAGITTVTVTYAGDSNISKSSASVKQTVEQ